MNFTFEKSQSATRGNCIKRGGGGSASACQIRAHLKGKLAEFSPESSKIEIQIHKRGDADLQLPSTDLNSYGSQYELKWNWTRTQILLSPPSVHHLKNRSCFSEALSRCWSSELLFGVPHILTTYELGAHKGKVEPPDPSKMKHKVHHHGWT